jgi:hypothetical protein
MVSNAIADVVVPTETAAPQRSAQRNASPGEQFVLTCERLCGTYLRFSLAKKRIAVKCGSLGFALIASGALFVFAPWQHVTR